MAEKELLGEHTMLLRSTSTTLANLGMHFVCNPWRKFNPTMLLFRGHCTKTERLHHVFLQARGMEVVD
jgi:hypothetical protein